MTDAGEDAELSGLLDALTGAERAERLLLLQELSERGVSLPSYAATVPRERSSSSQGRARSREPSAIRQLRWPSSPGWRWDSCWPPAVPWGSRCRLRRSAPTCRRTSRRSGPPGWPAMRAFREEEMLEVIRTLGFGLARAAEPMRALSLRLVLEPGVGELDLARRYAVAAAELAPLIAPMVTSLLTIHLREAGDSEGLTAADRAAGSLPGSSQVAVCFADLVGFTRLGQVLSPYELSGLAVRLEELVTEACSPPVKLVKTIGDAAMLTCPAPEPLIDATLALIELAAQRERHSRRCAPASRLGPPSAAPATGSAHR